MDTTLDILPDRELEDRLTVRLITRFTKGFKSLIRERGELWVQTVGYSYVPTEPYCSSWESTGPLMQSFGIHLSYRKNEAVASIPEICSGTSENPLRAIVICLIQYLEEGLDEVH